MIKLCAGGTLEEPGTLTQGASVFPGSCVCLLLQDLLQSCSRGGEAESGRHVL